MASKATVTRARWRSSAIPKSKVTRSHWRRPTSPDVDFARTSVQAMIIPLMSSSMLIVSGYAYSWRHRKNPHLHLRPCRLYHNRARLGFILLRVPVDVPASQMRDALFRRTVSRADLLPKIRSRVLEVTSPTRYEIQRPFSRTLDERRAITGTRYPESLVARSSCAR